MGTGRGRIVRDVLVAHRAARDHRPGPAGNPAYAGLREEIWQQLRQSAAEQAGNPVEQASVRHERASRPGHHGRSCYRPGRRPGGRTGGAPPSGAPPGPGSRSRAVIEQQRPAAAVAPQPPDVPADPDRLAASSCWPPGSTSASKATPIVFEPAVPGAAVPWSTCSGTTRLGQPPSGTSVWTFAVGYLNRPGRRGGAGHAHRRLPAGVAGRRVGLYVYALYATPMVAIVRLLSILARLTGCSPRRSSSPCSCSSPAWSACPTGSGTSTVTCSRVGPLAADRAGPACGGTYLLPGTLPYIAAGAAQGVAMGLVGMFIAEIFTQLSGLGNLLETAAQTYPHR